MRVSRLKAENFVHAWRNSNLPQRNLGPFSRQSNEPHAYPSRPFIAMSHFISFEPLIVPVYAPCLCLDAALLSTRRSNHDPLLTLTRSRMTAGGGGGEVQGPGESPVPPSRGSFSPHPVSLNFRCHLLIRGEVEEDACTQHVW